MCAQPSPVDLDGRPREVDLAQASPARIYNYLLDGCLNGDADRRRAEELLAIMPELRFAARSNRGFIRRFVRYAARRGVRQFLDLGAGFPMAGSVHGSVRAVVPDGHVLYVDNDPVVVAHSQANLAWNPYVECVYADVERPQEVLEAAEASHLVDLAQPVAVLLCEVLPFVPDSADPESIISTYHDAMKPGSFMAISHVAPLAEPGRFDQVSRIYDAIGHPLRLRSIEALEQLMSPFERMVEPGLVPCPSWRPEESCDAVPDFALCYAGVGAVQ